MQLHLMGPSPLYVRIQNRRQNLKPRAENVEGFDFSGGHVEADGKIMIRDRGLGAYFEISHDLLSRQWLANDKGNGDCWLLSERL